MSKAKFPQPWQISPTGPSDEYIVIDANDRKLFYIMGDEGDGADAPPSALFHGSDADHEWLMEEIVRRLCEEEKRGT